MNTDEPKVLFSLGMLAGLAAGVAGVAVLAPRRNPHVHDWQPSRSGFACACGAVGFRSLRGPLHGMIIESQFGRAGMAPSLPERSLVLDNPSGCPLCPGARQNPAHTRLHAPILKAYRMAEGGKSALEIAKTLSVTVTAKDVRDAVPWVTAMVEVPEKYPRKTIDTVLRAFFILQAAHTKPKSLHWTKRGEWGVDVRGIRRGKF